jgi:hypothetical protein
MNKAIVLVSYYFPPLNEIACLRTGQWAKYLGRADRRVIVLTAQKSAVDGAMGLRVALPESVTVIEIEFAPKWLLRLISKLRGINSTERAPSTSVSWLGGWGTIVAPFKQTAKAILRALSRPFGSLFDYRILWAVKAARHLRELQAENLIHCILSSYGPAASHLAVHWALGETGRNTRWILDYRDPWVGSHITAARFPLSLIEAKLQQRMVEDHAYALTTVSDELRNQLVMQAPGVPVHVIQNGIDIASYRALSIGAFAPGWDAAKRLFPGLQSGVFRIVYTGMIYRGTRNPAPLFRAIKNVRSRFPIKVMAEFYGKPGDLNGIIKSEGAEDFAVHKGIVSHDDAVLIQSNADLLLMLETDNASAIGVLTGKIFEYLISGRPILAIGVTPASAIGRLIEPLNAGEALGNDVAKIEQLLSECLSRKRHPTYRLMKEDLEPFSRERQVDSLLAIIDQDRTK